MSSNSSTVRVEALFLGAVQGVGFRYTARRLATQYHLAGYVQNLPTGEVELVAEAPDKTSLQNFLKELKHTPAAQGLSRQELCWSTARNEFESFRISYS
jgi:acylphosphatase